MAARTRKGTKNGGWPQIVKDRIKTSMLVNRLTDHVAGKCELSSTQVTAALGLLKKALPDLSSVEATVDGDMVQRVVTDQPMGEDEWATRYGDSLEASGGAAKSTH